MTVSTDESRNRFTANGVTVAFNFNFKIFAETDIVVEHYDALGVKTDYTLTTDYTVNAGPWETGGTVTALVAPPTGTLVVYRDLAETQATDYTENSKFPANSHEAALDKNLMLIQELLDRIKRMLQLSNESAYSGLSLPDPVANYFLQWKSDLSGLQNVAEFTPGALVVSSFVETLLNDADAAEFLTTLGVSSYIQTLLNDADQSTARATLGADTIGLSGSALTPYKNLVIANNVTNPTYQIDIDADKLVVADSSDNRELLSNANLTVDITASGANGLDTGSEASSTWYHLWVIYNGSTVAGLLSTSDSAPTMPSGYTYKGYVGAVYNSSGSDFTVFEQKDNKVISSNNLGVTGFTATTLTLVNLSLAIPSTAKLANLKIEHNYSAAGKSSVLLSASSSIVGGFYSSAYNTSAGAVVDSLIMPIITAQSIWADLVVTALNVDIYAGSYWEY